MEFIYDSFSGKPVGRHLNEHAKHLSIAGVARLAEPCERAAAAPVPALRHREARAPRWSAWARWGGSVGDFYRGCLGGALDIDVAPGGSAAYAIAEKAKTAANGCNRTRMYIKVLVSLVRQKQAGSVTVRI